MALVTRFLKLQDHDDTHVFTFVGTKSVTRDLDRDITSKDFRLEKVQLLFILILFSYGHHKWAVSLAREDKALSVLLLWRGGAQVRMVMMMIIIIIKEEHR